MSTEIHEGAVSATRYYGGTPRGVCIQLTSSMPLSPNMGDGLGRFIQAPYDDVVAMCRAVVAWDDYVKANGDDPVAPCAECGHLPQSEQVERKLRVLAEFALREQAAKDTYHLTDRLFKIQEGEPLDSTPSPK